MKITLECLIIKHPPCNWITKYPSYVRTIFQVVWMFLFSQVRSLFSYQVWLQNWEYQVMESSLKNNHSTESSAFISMIALVGWLWLTYILEWRLENMIRFLTLKYETIRQELENFGRGTLQFCKEALELSNSIPKSRIQSWTRSWLCFPLSQQQQEEQEEPPPKSIRVWHWRPSLVMCCSSVCGGGGGGALPKTTKDRGGGGHKPNHF